MTVYLAGELILLASAIVVGDPVQGAIGFGIVAIGTTTFTVGVARRRPEPRLAWWLVVAAAWALIVEALAVSSVYGITRAATITALVPVLLAALPYPLLAAALVLLSRVTARRGPVDALDAAMIALVGFLLLWLFLIKDMFTVSASSAAVAVALPISGLVVFAIAIKIVLGGGLRDPATGILILVVALLLTVTLSTFRLSLGTDILRTDAATNLLWTTHSILLGAIALLPSFTNPRRPNATATYDLSPSRLLLFGLLALVPVLAWAEEIVSGTDEALVTLVVPLIASAAFLLMLMMRLSMVARLAQRRAIDLEGRSSDLAQAVSEQEELQRELSFQASHDPLTGLANRLVLTDRMHGALTPSGQSVGTALLMLDLDGFKEVNDNYGHPVGDELLVQIAQRLRAATPPGATLARLGGDEFAILVDDTDRDTAMRIAECVVANLRDSYTIDRRELYVTTSVGVLAIAPDRPPTSDEALRKADVALYAAKTAGRNRAVLHVT